MGLKGPYKPEKRDNSLQPYIYLDDSYWERISWNIYRSVLCSFWISTKDEKLDFPFVTAASASFLDLYLEFDDSGQLSTKIYDKWDDFNFKIINFPNMCSNIPASPAYGVYISQLIRYARASSNYSDFLKRHLYLRNRLLDQGYKKIRLIRSLKKFIFRYQYLVEIYSVSAEKIISDAFS